MFRATGFLTTLKTKMANKKPKPSRFAPHILDLQIDANTPLPEKPSPELSKDIADVLYQQMQKRRLWKIEWLGYYSSEFDALVKYCYHKAIVRRIKGLSNHADKCKNIDNYVKWNIRTVLGELQEKNDRIGQAVYKNTNTAVLHLIEVGFLEIRSWRLLWRTKIHNETLLAFSTSDSKKPSDKNHILKVLHQMSLAAWNIGIQLKLTKKSKKTLEPLCEIFCKLRKSGIQCFKFKSLVDAIKKDVRYAYRTGYFNEDKQDGDSEDKTVTEEELAEEGLEFTTELYEQPDELYEELGEFCDEIRVAIDKSTHQFRVRQVLHQILVEREEAVKLIITELTPPSSEEQAKRLGISVDTFNEATEQQQRVEWARRLAISVDTLNNAIEQQPTLRSQEELAWRLGISTGELNSATKMRFSPAELVIHWNELAGQLKVSVDKLKKATQPEIKLPSQQELAELLTQKMSNNVCAGTINTDMKILRQLMRQLKETRQENENLNDWDLGTLFMIAKMLK